MPGYVHWDLSFVYIEFKLAITTHIWSLTWWSIHPTHFHYFPFPFFICMKFHVCMGPMQTFPFPYPSPPFPYHWSHTHNPYSHIQTHFTILPCPFLSLAPPKPTSALFFMPVSAHVWPSQVHPMLSISMSNPRIHCILHARTHYPPFFPASHIHHMHLRSHTPNPEVRQLQGRRTKWRHGRRRHQCTSRFSRRWLAWFMPCHSCWSTKTEPTRF